MSIKGISVMYTYNAERGENTRKTAWKALVYRNNGKGEKEKERKSGSVMCEGTD